MKVESFAEQLYFTTVKIKSFYSNNQVGSGTGFIFRYKNSLNDTCDFLVTNKHVINDSKIGNSTHGSFTFIKKEEASDRPKLGYGFQCDIDHDLWSKYWYGHPNPNIDIAIFAIGSTINYIQDDLKQPIFCKGISSELIPTREQLEKLDAIENITFVGYPNGIWDEVNLLPIVRQGTTATPLQVDYEGQPKFLIDASVFGGSSGSPVFVYNRSIWDNDQIYFVGVVAAVYHVNLASEIVQTPIPTNTNFVTEIFNKQMIDLGIVFKSQTIIETIEAFLKETKQQHLILDSA